MRKIKIIQIILFTLAVVALASCAAKKAAKSEQALPLKYDASSFDYLYSEALKQKLMGNGSEALKYLEQCRIMNPNSDAVYYQMAQILIGSGDLSNGKSYVKRAWELDKKNIWYSNLLSGIYFQENKLDSAIYMYEEAVVQSPGDDNLQVSLANLYSQKGDYDNAIRVHQTLHGKYGINENTTPAYISNLVLAGKLDVAMEETQEAIKLFPAEIKFHAQLADIYSKKGETAKAVEVYRQLLEENPQNPQILMSVCNFMLDEKMYDELFQVLGSVILDAEISMEEKVSFFSRIIATPNLAGKTVEQTLLSLMVLETVYENDDIVLLLRPELLDKNNRKTDAVKRLEEIISKHPDNYYAWEKLLL
ncbi:MAG: tetratricopeptide repeat protein [Bacteroidales bacterium]|jgi:tetratricopeptide (TPR) repeat protein|nr:tetratricopeptide repeat protein [Bacteroidales bacterium]